MLSNLMELYARRDTAINALHHHKKDLQQAVAALNEISAADIVGKEYAATIMKKAEDLEKAAQSVVLLENQIKLQSKD